MRMRLVTLAAALVLVAAATGTVAGQDISVSFGSSQYDSDEFCLNSSAFITDYTLGASGDLFGASASYDNSDWPWPKPPGSTGGGNSVVPAVFLLGVAQQEDRYMTQGGAFVGTVELFPLATVRRIVGGDRESGIGRIDSYLRPFIGAGVHVSGDGESASAGGGRDLPTFAIKGDTRPVVTYGARLYLPSRESPVRLQLQYYGTTMFVDEFELEGPNGETDTVESDNLTWGSWLIGVSFRIGG